MKLSQFLRSCLVAATCTGMMSAQFAQAAGPAVNAPAAVQVAPVGAKIQDIALQDRGILAGTVLNQNGAPCGAVPVTVSRQGEIVARTETNASGQFAVPGLSGGLYEVQTPIASNVYRLWAPRTAPPAAQALALITPNDAVVRAQLHNGGSALGWLANPWVLAAVVAAAIAIPLALDDDDAS
jgi:hypothetical protein